MRALVFVISILFIVLSAVHAAPQPRVFTVVEHAVTDTVRHFVPGQDSIGDILAFANPILDASNTTMIGSDSGHCVRTIVGALWECMWTLFLNEGQITVEGPFRDSGVDTQFAITGGTGVFASARGSMTLHYRDPNGSEFDFIYKVLLPSTSELDGNNLDKETDKDNNSGGHFRISEFDSSEVLSFIKYLIIIVAFTVCGVASCFVAEEKRRKRQKKQCVADA